MQAIFKKLFIILSFPTLLIINACDGKINANEETKSEVTFTKDCEKSVDYGDTALCLPIIKGMNETFKNETVRDFVEKFNYPGNTILAFYLNDSDVKNLNDGVGSTLDDYFQIYVANKMKDLKFQDSDMDALSETFFKNYVHEKWEDLEAKISKTSTVEFDKPIAIESYSISPNSKQFVLLLKTASGKDEHVSVCIINMYNIKNRMFFGAYYKIYENEKTLSLAKGKNDYIMKKIFEVNE